MDTVLGPLLTRTGLVSPHLPQTGPHTPVVLAPAPDSPWPDRLSLLDTAPFDRFLSKAKATFVPPYWLYDCAIDLFQERLCQKDICTPCPEHHAMEESIKSLPADIIMRLSSSSGGASFLLTKKKDKVTGD